MHEHAAGHAVWNLALAIDALHLDICVSDRYVVAIPRGSTAAAMLSDGPALWFAFHHRVAQAPAGRTRGGGTTEWC